jgi:hypothetical protein
VAWRPVRLLWPEDVSRSRLNPSLGNSKKLSWTGLGVAAVRETTARGMSLGRGIRLCSLMSPGKEREAGLPAGTGGKFRGKSSYFVPENIR